MFLLNFKTNPMLELRVCFEHLTVFDCSTVRNKMERLNENLPVWSLILILWSTLRGRDNVPTAPSLYFIRQFISTFILIKNMIFLVLFNPVWTRNSIFKDWRRSTRMDLTLSLPRKVLHKIKIKLQTGKFSFNLSIWFK